VGLQCSVLAQNPKYEVVYGNVIRNDLFLANYPPTSKLSAKWERDFIMSKRSINTNLSYDQTGWTSASV